MILEHAWVTTWDQPTAAAAAQELLSAMNFEFTPLDDGAWIQARHRVPKRGVVDRAAKSVRLDFDRQRITLGASIAVPPRAKRGERELLMALAGALEARLAHQAPLDQALRIWNDAMAAGAIERKRRVRNAWIIIGLCLGLPFMFLAIVLATK